VAGNVLVVDDDDDIRDTLRLALEVQGYEVLTASDGREALELLRSRPRPGLILLDLMMPVLDGWEFVKELDRDPQMADIPIVVITAYADRARPMPRSVMTIEKPLDLLDLLDAVKRSYRAPVR
jgi:CheY-like chemotaxis protein